jgi:ribosome biogenesis protein Tsr3
MVISKEKALISVAIDKDVKTLLEKYSREIDLTLSKFARNLIYIALDDFKILKQTGVIRLAMAFRSLLETFPKFKKREERKISEEEENSVSISVIIDSEVKELLENYASETGLTLKMFARNLIYIALDDFELLRKAGLVRLACAFRKFMESFENYEVNNTKRINT